MRPETQRLLAVLADLDEAQVLVDVYGIKRADADPTDGAPLDAALYAWRDAGCPDAANPRTAVWHTRTVGPYKGWTELRRSNGHLVGRYILRPTHSGAAFPWLAYRYRFEHRFATEAEARAYIAQRLPKGVEVVGG